MKRCTAELNAMNPARYTIAEIVSVDMFSSTHKVSAKGIVRLEEEIQAGIVYIDTKKNLSAI